MTTIASSTTSTLNLKYLKDQDEKASFPWLITSLFLFCISLVGIGIWLFYHRNLPECYVHHIVPGDTLRSLAEKYYHDADLWKVIFLANRKKLINQKPLVPGETILIPKNPKKTDASQKQPQSAPQTQKPIPLNNTKPQVPNQQNTAVNSTSQQK